MATDKKEVGFFILKIIALAVIVFIAVKTRSSIIEQETAFMVPLFTFFLLLVGLVIWTIIGEPVSEHISSFILQSGGKISKTKYYSRARALVMQNKLQEGIELYQKILDKDNTDITVYSEMADIYFEKLKDYSAAFNCYDKIEQYGQESSDIVFAINRKADIYLSDLPADDRQAGKNDSKAVAELEKITQKFPNTKDALRAEERIKNLKHKVIQNG